MANNDLNEALDNFLKLFRSAPGTAKNSTVEDLLHTAANGVRNGAKTVEDLFRTAQDAATKASHADDSDQANEHVEESGGPVQSIVIEDISGFTHDYERWSAYNDEIKGLKKRGASVSGELLALREAARQRIGDRAADMIIEILSAPTPDVGTEETW